MTTLASRILGYIDTHPGHKVSEIAKALDASISNVSSTLTHKFKRGLVRRALVARTLTGAPIYGYYAPNSDNVVCTSENVVCKPPKAQRKQKVVAADPLDTFLKAAARELVDGLFVRVRKEIASRKGELLQSLTGESVESGLASPPQVALEAVVPLTLPKLVPPVHETRTTLRRIGVIGLLPQQCGELQKEFGDCLDLTFWNDGPQSSLKALAVRCEAVFLHTRHMSHVTDEALKHAGANIIRVTGGTHNMKEAITKYFVEAA